MRIRLQQFNPTIGAIPSNTRSILESIGLAEEDKVDLLILPEMSVCGYPPMDLLEKEHFREAVYNANREIISATGECSILFGTIIKNPEQYGRPCFNSAVLAGGGKQLGTTHKTLLPTYDVFDDLRYFEPNAQISCLEFKGVKLGVTICEDIFYNENDIQYHRYEINPARELRHQGAQIIINISASPFTKTKPKGRQKMLQDRASEYGLPVLYVNQAGAQTELIFDGDSLAVDRNAEIVARAPLFEDAYVDLEWDPSGNGLYAPGGPPPAVPAREETIFDALVLGLKDYLAKTGITDRVLVGLSGGIDSALVACIAAEALGGKQVTAVTMPSEFSSKGSVSDSEQLAVNLGIRFEELPIAGLYEEYLEVLEPVFKGTAFNEAEENLQSRIRGVLLMAYSNKHGHMLLNTGNKSELATGYCTLYGDMAGGLGIISDLYKTEVYNICSWLNREHYKKEIIPRSVIDKPPSAELRPDQKDSDSLPEYAILDEILYRYIELQQSPGQITAAGFEPKLVRNIVELVDYNEYKRFQAVPGLKVSTKSFGSGRRLPIVQKWTAAQFKSR